MGVCLRQPRDSHQDMIKILSLILMAGLLADTRALPINGFTVNAGVNIDGDLIFKSGQVGTISETVGVDCAEPSLCVSTLVHTGNDPVFPLSPNTEYNEYNPVRPNQGNNNQVPPYIEYGPGAVKIDGTVYGSVTHESGQVGTISETVSVDCAEPSLCVSTLNNTGDGPIFSLSEDRFPNVENTPGKQGANEDYYDTPEYQDSYSIDCTESATCSSTSYHYGDEHLFPSRDAESPKLDNFNLDAEKLNEENNNKVLFNTEYGIVQDGQVGTRNLAHDVSEVGHQSSSENSDVVINCGGSAQCLGTRIHNGDQPFFG